MGQACPPTGDRGWFGDAVTDPVNGSEDDCYSPANISFPGDGTMHLNVTQTRSHCRGVTKPFSGALVSTNPDDGRAGSGFQYGYGVLEARVYIPADGSEIADWPAVWADGQHWPEDGEDDVMEGLGGRACWHFQIPPGAPSRGCDTSLTPGWHTFASDWRAGSVTFFYDGVDVGAVTSGITAAPMYLVLDNTTKAINPIADAMKVQYVRVWQRGSGESIVHRCNTVAECCCEPTLWRSPQ